MSRIIWRRLGVVLLDGDGLGNVFKNRRLLFKPIVKLEVKSRNYSHRYDLAKQALNVARRVAQTGQCPILQALGQNRHKHRSGMTIGTDSDARHA
ncbi:MAG: hypothetical protein QGH33_02580 [Pirellulaceae bacterium]|nr:hypothetical protein [Pirellulaceae bacterium]